MFGFFIALIFYCGVDTINDIAIEVRKVLPRGSLREGCFRVLFFVFLQRGGSENAFLPCCCYINLTLLLRD